MSNNKMTDTDHIINTIDDKTRELIKKFMAEVQIELDDIDSFNAIADAMTLANNTDNSEAN